MLRDLDEMVEGKTGKRRTVVGILIAFVLLALLAVSDDWLVKVPGAGPTPEWKKTLTGIFSFGARSE